MDEVKLHRQRSKGHKAQLLWDNEILQEAFAAIEKEVFDAWKLSNSEERERREEIYYLQRAHEALKQKIKAHIYAGTVAGKQLEEREKAKKK